MANYQILDEMKAKLESLRPIDPIRWEPVAEKFRLDWTYHSNALEGNPLTLGETSFFIREGLTSKGKPLAAYLEVKNHVAALDYLEGVVKEDQPLTVSLIRQYHAMLFKNIEFLEVRAEGEKRRVKIEAGVYKSEDNFVIRLDGKVRQFVPPLQVPSEIEKLVAGTNKNDAHSHPIELAAVVHHQFASIHPFVDGNGRVARLLMNTILMRAGYTPAIISVEDKKRYLEALQAADDGSYVGLFALIEEAVNKSLRTTIDVLEGRDAFDFDDLARMFRNITNQSEAIQHELGPAVVPPEERARQTGASIMALVEKLMGEHIKSASTSSVALSPFKSQGLAVTQTLIGLQQRLSTGTPGTCIGFQTSCKDRRFVPALRVEVVSLSGRFSVCLAAFIRVGQLTENRQDTFGEPYAAEMEGSLYFEDWDSTEISNFIVNTLKDAYKKWAAEMEKRKSMIAAEESEVEKYRSRHG